MTGALPERARIVIIGGGIIGASTLYHLAKEGVRDCVLLERDRFASGTTWHAAGLTTRIRESHAQSRLVQYTSDLFRSLEAETGQATGYRENGALYIATNPIRHELLRRQSSASQHMGVRVDALNAGEVKERWPLLHVDDVLGGVFIHGNGQVNPLDATMALIKGARQWGGLAFEHTSVEDVLIRDGRAIGVRTPRGDIACDRVLLAGGLWSHKIAKRLGVAVPLHGAEHYYIVTEPMPSLARTTPVLGNPDERAYYKEDAGKLLVGFFEAVARPWPPKGEEIPKEFSFVELPGDLEHIQPQLNLAFRRVPALKDVGIKLFFCGPESFTSDSRALMGPTAEVRGLYVAAGFNSYGILSSGGAGKVMAAWLMDGIPPLAMTAMHAQRVMPFQANTRYMQDRVVEALGFNMSLHWPGHQLQERTQHPPLPRARLSDGLWCGYGRAGRMGDPPLLRYPRRVAPEDAEPRLSGVVSATCRRVHGGPRPGGTRRPVVLRKAPRQRPPCSRGPQLGVGERNGRARGSLCVHALAQRSRGHRSRPGRYPPITAAVLDRHWTRRAGARSLLVRGQHPSGPQCPDPRCDRAVRDVLAQWASLAWDPAGPLTDADLSSKALPFGHAQLVDIGYGRAWVLRRSYFGELGYEVYPTTDLCRLRFSMVVYPPGIPAEFSHRTRRSTKSLTTKVTKSHEGTLRQRFPL